ncbi:MAG TPA: hypothetical protein VLA41_08550 [Burkholderiales bacterium]|nr:hypothetical protein [Burkholderiales bacterium]
MKAHGAQSALNAARAARSVRARQHGRACSRTAGCWQTAEGFPTKRCDCRPSPSTSASERGLEERIIPARTVGPRPDKTRVTRIYRDKKRLLPEADDRVKPGDEGVLITHVRRLSALAERWATPKTASH